MVGHHGSGTLNITGGGEVISNGVIGYESDSTGKVTVIGTEATWTNSGPIDVDTYGSGTLNVTDGGLVSIAGTLTIDCDEDGEGLFNIATGGMLALYGDADDSLTEFLDLIVGTDAIRLWDNSISDWADITGAIYGGDYTLGYLTEGDLAGYTMLTVYTPEPGPDFDDDGDVDGADFLYWQLNDGSESNLTVWQENFGNDTSPMTAASTGVPEPSTVALLSMGLAVVVTWRRVRSAINACHTP